MRVAFLTPSLHGGGAERVVRRWARTLRDRGHDVAVLTYIEGAYAEHEPEDLGLEGIERRHFPGTASRAGWRRLPVWIREAVIDTRAEALVSVLTFSNLAALMAFPTRARRPAVLISERNPLTPLLRSEGPSGRAKLALAHAMYRHADAAVAISHPVAGDLASLYAIEPSRLYVVPNPVFTSLPDVPREDIRGKLRVVFVGRHVPQKNPHLFLETLDVLRRRGRQPHGVMYGDGPLRADLEARAAGLGVACDFRGWREDWQELLEPGDTFLLPSLVEGFGNVLVEAAARSVPVVAPAQALGVADAIVPGVTGSIALSARPEHLADAVEHASRIRPDDASRDAWLRWFSQANSTDRLEKVLETVLRER